MVYGNDAGLVSNVRFARHAGVRAQTTVAGPADALLLSLRQQGFVMTETEVDPARLAAIRDRYQRLIDDPQATRDLGAGLSHASRYVIDPLVVIPGISALLTAEVAAVIRAYYHGEFQVDTVRAWRNYHFEPTGDHQDVYGNLWHNDEGPSTTLRYFVALSDTADGALELQSIDSTKQIMRSGFFRRQMIWGPARRMLEDRQRISRFSGSLGSGCLWNPQLCLHRAGVPGPGRYRDMVQFWIIPATTTLRPDWHRHVRPDVAVARAASLGG